VKVTDTVYEGLINHCYILAT